MNNNYTEFLNKSSENDWLTTLENLLPEIHAVDRSATQIWFRFYPLELFRTLRAAENKDEIIQKFVMQGDYELKNRIDSSHKFLYGHRFWTDVKEAVEHRAASFKDESAELTAEIKQIAQSVSDKLKVDKSLLTGICAAGLMTLAQAGFEAFKAAKGEVEKPKGLLAKLPDQIVARRGRDDSQGLFGFLKTVDKEFSVTYDEQTGDGKFKIFYDEELASGAARDQSKNWLEKDARCGEGVIPVECRSAACGTCWVGVLGGAEKLSDVSPRERKQMKIHGYRQGDESKPLLRLACQARAEGAVSIVIPPWNGVFGKKVYGNVADVELEPATTSAVKLREIIAGATENQ
ncbi:MAG: (2Fe-2S)-binding protein [Acidobacteriota bacterium]|nr:(2Fe-2S)-binding protein [Acidobacteriota bacterium]